VIEALPEEQPQTKRNVSRLTFVHTSVCLKFSRSGVGGAPADGPTLIVIEALPEESRIAAFVAPRPLSA
jgi:hypothetical protein